MTTRAKELTRNNLKIGTIYKISTDKLYTFPLVELFLSINLN